MDDKLTITATDLDQSHPDYLRGQGEEARRLHHPRA